MTATVCTKLLTRQTATVLERQIRHSEIQNRPLWVKTGQYPPDECLNEAAERAKTYADAGADGIFVPGLNDLALIEKLVQLSPLPVNIMVTRGIPEIADLARVGVRRVSLGPWPMMAAMRVIGQAAAAVAASKQYGTFLRLNA